jgi:hypothetical protein
VTGFACHAVEAQFVEQPSQCDARITQDIGFCRISGVWPKRVASLTW